MREAIRQILIENIAEVEGRVYEPHAANKDTKTPYLVVVEGVQEPEADWSAFSTIIEVWPYVKRTTFQKVDMLANAVINVLHHARFSYNDEEYLVDYIGTTGQDFVDEEWDTITRGLRFRVIALGWLNGLTYDPDPVKTLREWVEQKYDVVQTDPTNWSPSDTTPGVYWRLVRLTPIETTAAINWIEAQINCHILTPSPIARLAWTREITEALTKQRRLKMSDGGPLDFIRVSADSEADPMRRGQIVLTARFGVLQPQAEQEMLNRAVVSGDIDMEVS